MKPVLLWALLKSVTIICSRRNLLEIFIQVVKNIHVSHASLGESYCEYPFSICIQTHAIHNSSSIFFNSYQF